MASGMLLEQRPHVADVRDGNADLADLAAGQHMVGIIAGLGRQVEGHRKAGLALGQIGAVTACSRSAAVEWPA